MSKVTTADCKEFLVEEIAKNPTIINEIFNCFLNPLVMADALNEDKWVLEKKFKATGKHGLAETEYQTWSSSYESRGGQFPEYIEATDLKWVRVFNLDGYNGQVAFYVLEDNQGNLILGSYVGE